MCFNTISKKKTKSNDPNSAASAESLFSKKQHGRTARGNDLDITTEPVTFKSLSWP